MPAIYQGKCSRCGYESPSISDVQYGGVIADEPSTIKRYAVHPDDERVIVLAHPLEQHIIQEHGHSYTSATFQGRYLRFKAYFCKSCGHVYETRQLASASLVFGCFPPLLIAIIIGVTIGWLRASIADGVFAALFATVLAGTLIDWLVGVYIRLRYAHRAREFNIGRICPECGSRRTATGGTLPCPCCHQRLMKVRFVGMS